MYAKVKLSHEFEEANKTAVDKWMTEALFFIDLRNNQERDWLLLEARRAAAIRRTPPILCP